MDSITNQQEPRGGVGMKKVLRLEDLEAKDAASLLGVTPRMLRNYVSKHGIPCEGAGRKRRFSWPVVRKWFVAYHVEIALKSGKKQKPPCCSRRNRCDG
jgi:hypothetical protein